MPNELNLTPTQGIVVIVICLVILILLWHYDKPSDVSDTNPTEKPKDYVKERYGAYIWLSNKRYN